MATGLCRSIILVTRTRTMRAAFPGILVCTLLCLSPASGWAASRTLKAGEVLGVSEDIVLTGDDVLEVQGTAEKPCRLDGNGQQIRTRGEWRGRVKIDHCEFRGLGSMKSPALDLTSTGDGDRVIIEHSEFHACGAIHLANEGNSATI